MNLFTKRQETAWEREYQKPRMLSRKNVPHADVVRFMRELKKTGKKEGVPLDVSEMTVLDLGSGTGRNAFYFAEQGARVVGFEFSDTALQLAKRYAENANLSIDYRKQDIGALYPLPDTSVDLAIDVTSSNSLDATGREIYLKEVQRVLKEDGKFFVRALCREGDQNAKVLIRDMPGHEPNTYIHPDLALEEKVFSEAEFRETYEPYFTIERLERSFHYTTVAGRRYKRAFWIARLSKKNAHAS
ncbi:MAG TPA: class I SAM-dependent methyltransferase [Candidatus Paceibacterota bacterium]|jgi:SAM-dependent methyltransferase